MRSPPTPASASGSASDPARFDVFFSYNSRDRQGVERIAARLKREGLEPWLDMWSLTPGGRWQEELPRGLAASSACAVFVGPQDLGGWERFEVELALDRAATERGFRVFPVLLPGLEPFDPNSLPPFLRTRTWIDFRRGVESGRALEDLVRAVKGVPFGPTVAIEPREDVCPYRGLQVFDESHAEFFFGREGDSQRLLERLKLGRFLAVVGPSGSGKSSLVRAGLVPSLRSGRLPGSERWEIRVFRPGGRPLAALAAQLLALSDERGMQRTVDELAGDRRSLHLAVALALGGQPPERRVAFVVDQFEEVFTLCRDEGERSRLLDNLLYAATVPGGQALVILTLRADFYPRLARYRELAQLVQAQQLLVAPLDEDGLRQAIEQPAFGAGLEIEAGLVDTILSDVAGQPGVLPLLEHALLETWRRRRGGMLTLEGYRDSGGVRGALSERAEEIYASLSGAQRALARRLLLRLTEPGEGTEDTRRRAALEELISAPGERDALEEVVRDLTDARLLTTAGEGETGERWVDVSHEALIRGWPRLRSWIEEDRAGLRTHRQLTDAAQEWERHRRDPGALYRGALLAEAVEWQQGRNPDLNQLERDFLTASQAAEASALTRERRRVRRLRVLLLGLVVLLAAAAGTALLAARQTQKANQQARIALSRALAEQALANSNSNPDLALLLGLEAYRRESTPEARNALITAIQESAGMNALLRGHERPVTALFYSPDGKTLASADQGGTLRLWDVERRRPLGKPLATGAGVSEGDGVPQVFSRDGKTFISGDEDGTLRLWDVDRRRQLTEVTPAASAAESVALSPDGKTIALGGEALRLFDIHRHRQLGKPLSADGCWSSVAFSPGGQTLAASNECDNPTLRLWDVDTRRPLGKPLAIGEGVSEVTFGPDGKTLALGGEDGTLRFWDIGRGHQLGQPVRAASDGALSVAFSRDGETLASADDLRGTLRLWNVARRHPLGRPLATGEGVSEVTFSPDGKTLALGREDGTLRLWNVDPRRRLTQPLPAGGGVPCVASGPDGKTLVLGGEDGTLRLWDLDRRRQLGKPFPAGQEVTTDQPGSGPLATPEARVAFTPDCKMLATGDANAGNVRFWDLGRRRPLGKPLAIGHRPVSTLALSADGKTLATADLAGTWRLWDVDSRRPLGAPLPLGQDVAHLTLSADGKTLASVGLDGVRLWDVDHRRQLGSTLGPASGDQFQLLQVSIVAFSPDDTTLAWIDRQTVRLWDIDRRRQLDEYDAGEVSSLAFSPDGKTLAVVADDELKLWDVDGHRRLGKPLSASGHSMSSVAFSPDGKRLATGGDRISIWDPVLWSTRAEVFEDHICPVLGRSLTRDEWAFYLPDEPYRETCGQR